jgi:hypothetical protein
MHADARPRDGRSHHDARLDPSVDAGILRSQERQSSERSCGRRIARRRTGLHAGLEMTSGNGRTRAELAAATAKAVAAERLAGAVLGAFDICEQAGVPLSQLQKIALVEAVLLEFDGLEAQLCSLATVEEQLRGLASRELSHPNGR